MKRIWLVTATGLLGAGQAIAQSPASAPMAAPAPTIMPAPTNDEVRAPRPARARGIPTALAIEGAQTAIATCLGNTYKVSALIVDSAGVPIELISGDGAA